jgi:tetratricopeptide (TPR) repeat protein
MHQPMNRSLLVLMASAMLASCASSPKAPSGSQASAPIAAEPAVEALPNVPLDAATLYNILLGEIAGQRGQVGVAAQTLGKVAQQTRDPRLAERATLAATYARRFEEALVSAKLWVELQPDDPDARESLAGILMELDRPDEALVQFERLIVLETPRSNPEQAYMRVVSVLSRHTQRASALTVMQQLVDQNPKVPAAQFALTHLSVRMGDFPRALQAADTALVLRPGWEEAALFKARILVSLKEMGKAQQFYEEFLAQYPHATTVRLNYARHLIDQRQWSKARSEFTRVLSDMPNDADTIYAIALLSLQTQELDDAEKYLKRTLALRPQHDQARYYLGQVAEQRKDYAEAIRWYSEIGPGENYFEAQTRIGMMKARQGDIPGALAHLRSLSPTTDQQRVQLILSEEQILREARKYEEALAVLNQGLKQLPGDKDLLYARALIAEKLNLIQVVESDLRSVLKKDPKNAHALNALGYTLADRTNRLQEANALLSEALALRPDDAFILDSMGWLQYRMGNNAEAVRYLKRALEVRNDAEIAAHLGEVLWVMGNRREAESVWSRALRETPDNEAVLDAIKKFKQ